MSEFSGCVAFTVERPSDRNRSGPRDIPGSRSEFDRTWCDQHARLVHAQTIVTPEDRSERQPTVDDAGGVLVFDGYLFDRDGLVAQHGFASTLSDSAMAAAWLGRYGPASLSRLRGDYALAQWDPLERRLTLAVAAMANRLIYFHRAADTIWFANTLPALFRFPDVPRNLDPLQLALLLINQSLDAGATVYRDIGLVSPGTLLTVTTAGMREDALWRPDPSRRLRQRRDEDYIEAAREILTRSVRNRLRLAGPPASMLSAGLDSSAVAATAARLVAPAPLRAYTMLPASGSSAPVQDGWYADERSGVETIAHRYPNLCVAFCQSDEPAGIERDPTPLFEAACRPYSLLNQLSWFDPLYRRAAEDGHVALLTGDFGNFTLSFDGMRGLNDLLRQGRFDLLARLVPSLARSTKRPIAALLKRYLIGPLLGPRIRDGISWYRHRRAPWSQIGAVREDFADKLRLDERLWQAGLDGELSHCGDSRTVLAQFAHLRRSRIVEHVNAIRAHYGVEHRDPLADSDLVDFCLAIPREQFILGGTPRSFARRVLADRLPGSVVRNLDRGQQNPEWHRRLTPQRQAFADEIERLQHVPLAADLLDLPRLRSLLADWPVDPVIANRRRYEYESLVPRAIQMGRFIRWADRSNAPVHGR